MAASTGSATRSRSWRSTITQDEVAIAILGHRRPNPGTTEGQQEAWGPADGRWAVADDFQYRLWLIDRHTGEMILLSDNGHKRTAADHQHPTFNADGTRIDIQSAMLSKDGRSMNICIVPVPKSWLARRYADTIVR